MRKLAFIFSILALAAIVSCSTNVSATAIIRVAHGDPSQISADEDTVSTVLTSYLFGQHVDEKLGLSKLWGLSEAGVVTRLGKAITVKAGNEPGLFVITCKGLEHGVAVKILNELCVFYTQQQIEVSDSTSQPQMVHVSIVQRAE